MDKDKSEVFKSFTNKAIKRFQEKRSENTALINTPAPALAHAIYNATGLWFRELPITSEQIAMGIAEKECE